VTGAVRGSDRDPPTLLLDRSGTAFIACPDRMAHGFAGAKV